MNIVFASTYKQGATKFLAIHHTGAGTSNPLGSTQSMKAYDVSELHKAKWNFPSSYMLDPLGKPWYGGYNFYIQADGIIVQFRAVGEETAAQLGFNFDGLVVSCCLAGNFSPGGKDKPTAAQIATLQELRATLSSMGVTVPEANIVPHRHFGSTECFGMALSDDWAQVASRPTTKPVVSVDDPQKVVALQQQLSLLQQLFALLTTLINLKRKVTGISLPPKQRQWGRENWCTGSSSNGQS